MNRLPSFALASLLVVSVACGGTVSGGPPSLHSGSPYIGEIVATSEQGAQYFGVNLQLTSVDTTSCTGATKTAGACCYFPPLAPPPTQPPGGGTPGTELNAGPI